MVGRKKLKKTEIKKNEFHSNEEINELETVSVKSGSKDSFIYLSSIDQ